MAPSGEMAASSIGRAVIVSVRRWMSSQSMSTGDDAGAATPGAAGFCRFSTIRLLRPRRSLRKQIFFPSKLQLTPPL